MRNARRLGTELYLRLTCRRVIEREQRCANGIEAEVFWFDTDESTAGHATPFGTIALNHGVLDSLPEQDTEYVFLHEYGHTLVPWPIRLLFYAVYIPSMFALVGGIIGLLAIGVESIVGGYTLVATVGRMLGMVLGICLFGLIAYGTIRVDELWAEYVALRNMGVEQFKAVHKRWEQRSPEKSFLGRIHSWLSYPDYETVIWLSEIRE